MLPLSGVHLGAKLNKYYKEKYGKNFMENV